MTDIDLEGLDPGIRQTVQFLRNNGFETTDSGDGKSKFHGEECECALPFPNVAIQTEPDQLIHDADRLRGLLEAHGISIEETGDPLEDPRVAIQASYDPATKVGIIVVFNLDDDKLPEPKETPHHPFTCKFCATMARD